MDDNDIACANGLVSSYHAVIKRIGASRWIITDSGSANGVFVNGTKIESSDLLLGDKVYIIGMQIIMGVGFISVNNNRSIRISNKLKRVDHTIQIKNQEITYRTQQEYDSIFNRLPRRRIAFTPQKIYRIYSKHKALCLQKSIFTKEQSIFSHI